MRQTNQLGSGFVAHAVLALLIVFLLPPPETSYRRSSRMTPMLVWTPGAGGGGNKGGDGAKAAPAVRTRPPAQTPQFTIPAVPVAAAVLELPGVTAVPGLHDAAGRRRGRREGARPGRRTGRGLESEEGPPGPGEGLLPPGTPGLVDPIPVFEKKPEYTTAALTARLQGSVMLEVVVLADGAVGRVRVVRSLDSQLGLDQKAIEAVRSGASVRPGTTASRLRFRC